MKTHGVRVCISRVLMYRIKSEEGVAYRISIHDYVGWFALIDLLGHRQDDGLSE